MLALSALWAAYSCPVSSKTTCTPGGHRRPGGAASSPPWREPAAGSKGATLATGRAWRLCTGTLVGRPLDSSCNGDGPRPHELTTRLRSRSDGRLHLLFGEADRRTTGILGVRTAPAARAHCIAERRSHRSVFSSQAPAHRLLRGRRLDFVPVALERAPDGPDRPTGKDPSEPRSGASSQARGQTAVRNLCAEHWSGRRGRKSYRRILCPS